MNSLIWILILTSSGICIIGGIIVALELYNEIIKKDATDDDSYDNKLHVT